MVKGLIIRRQDEINLINMVNIRCFIIVMLLFLFSACGNAQKKSDSNDFIFGKWKYVKHFNWRATRYGDKEIQSIKIDTLIIETNKIYFAHSKFVEPCTFSNIWYKSFFDRDDKEPNVVENRALAMKYTKKELNTFKRIETNCDPYNCLGILYLKQDTLILNYCGGGTFLMLKVSH